MLEIARLLVQSAITYADLALQARENGWAYDAARHARNADRVAACAARASAFYVIDLGGDPECKAVDLLTAAESYGREPACF